MKAASWPRFRQRGGEAEHWEVAQAAYDVLPPSSLKSHIGQMLHMYYIIVEAGSNPFHDFLTAAVSFAGRDGLVDTEIAARVANLNPETLEWLGGLLDDFAKLDERQRDFILGAVKIIQDADDFDRRDVLRALDGALNISGFARDPC